MTFEPGGDTHIPNQIGTSGRRRGSGRLHPGSPEALRRFVLTMGILGSVLLAAVVIGVYVLELTDPETGVWWILGVAVLEGVVFTAGFMRHQRQRVHYAESIEASLQAGSATAVSGPPGQASGRSTHQDTALAGHPGTKSRFSFQVEDTFTITGRGTVATGQVTEGEVANGQAVAITRDGATVGQATVAAVELTRRMVEVARAGDSAGLLLPGVNRADIHPGDVIVPR